MILKNRKRPEYIVYKFLTIKIIFSIKISLLLKSKRCCFLLYNMCIYMIPEVRIESGRTVNNIRALYESTLRTKS